MYIRCFWQDYHQIRVTIACPGFQQLFECIAWGLRTPFSGKFCHCAPPIVQHLGVHRHFSGAFRADHFASCCHLLLMKCALHCCHLLLLERTRMLRRSLIIFCAALALLCSDAAACPAISKGEGCCCSASDACDATWAAKIVHRLGIRLRTSPTKY